MASIRDVAKKANVAACTVSRVLNGTAHVAPETKMKIEQAMKELNYIPNELARGMFRQRAGIIAMLVPNIRHPFFSSLAGYMEKELYECGYKLMLCSTDDDLEREQEYMNMLKSNIVDGVIMGVNSLDDSEYESFQKPLVMLDYQVNQQIPVVASNHGLGGRLAAEEFIRSGCKSVIHICGESKKKVLSYESHEELERVLQEHKIACRRVTIPWNDFDFDGYLGLAKTILQESPEIDGLMSADMPCTAFLKAAVQLGKRIPEDFCAVSYDGTYVVNMNLIDITTIKQPVKEIAKQTIAVLKSLLEGKAPRQNRYALKVSLVKGSTTRTAANSL